ncbi:Spy/CpxP family protein refolding chaperone [Bosea sp. 2RAB26]|uniref:Spy/CpxP family protein refolding chaperone n=1 Tax=Bosea sp. 2RAB26 TaxID=3237476 RepID=UPI003F9125E4
MKRIALIAASSAAALAATFAVAQPQPVPPAGGSGSSRDMTQQERTDQRDQRRTEQMEARMKERLERAQTRMNERFAKLRADMKLKPEQVPLFDAVENTVKKGMEQRRQGFAAMREQRENFRHADIMERLDAMASRQAARATRSKELADAVRPLWSTLSDEQKTVARRAVREAFSEGRARMERMGENMRDRWQDRRGGRDRDGDDRGSGRGRYHSDDDNN